MGLPESKMQSILDSTIEGLFSGDDEASPAPAPEASPPAPVVAESPELDEVDTFRADAPEAAQEPPVEAIAPEPAPEPEAAQEPVETPTEDLSEDGFVVQGDVGPELYMGKDDDGQDWYMPIDEVLGDTPFKIKAAGAEHDVTFAEMQKGYQRQAHFTQEMTKLAERERTIAPYIALVHQYQNDNKFRNLITDYVQDAKTSTVSEAEINAALDEGDTEKAKALINRQRELAERRAQWQASERMEQQQQQMLYQENQRLAAQLIPDYNSNISRVKDYMVNEGFDDNSVAQVEYLPPLAQKVFFTAAMASAQPLSSAKSPNSPAKRALRGKTRRVVKRPPKASRSGPVQSVSENAAKQRRAKAAFKRAHETGSIHDMAHAVAQVLPDDF